MLGFDYIYNDMKMGGDIETIGRHLCVNWHLFSFSATLFFDRNDIPLTLSKLAPSYLNLEQHQSTTRRLVQHNFGELKFKWDSMSRSFESAWATPSEFQWSLSKNFNFWTIPSQLHSFCWHPCVLLLICFTVRQGNVAVISNAAKVLTLHPHRCLPCVTPHLSEKLFLIEVGNYCDY